MKKLNAIYLLIFILNSFSIIKVAEVAYREYDQSMRREHTQPFNVMESILTDPAFKELQRAHAKFKKIKESLGKRLDNQQINKDEFHRKMRQIRDHFETIKNSIKAKYSSHRLYSFLEAQDLIEKLRDLQRAEESPLRDMFLDKANYNRKQFERERIAIERKYEPIRAYLNAFYQELKTPREQQLRSALQELQQGYKNSLYDLKVSLLSPSTQTYEKELEFQAAEQKLLQEYNQKRGKILEELRQLSQTLQDEDVISQVVDQQESIAGSGAVAAAANQDQQQQAKMIAIPKINFLPSKL